MTTAANIPSAEPLASALGAAGFDAVLVGGAVRDALLGVASGDLDLVTDATPAQVRALCEGAEWVRGVYAVGERFGTIGVALADGRIVEVSRYREDALASRSASERFTVDAGFRDFTVNAIGFDLAERTLLDPLDGQRDLADGVLRAPLCPEKRFAEDPLRVLRLARFTAQLGFTPDAATASAAQHAAATLDAVAIERVRDELTKLLVSPHASEGLRIALETGALSVVLPEVAALDGVTQPSFHDLDVLAHTFATVDNAPATLELRWAALLHDVGKGPTRTVEADGRIRFLGHATVGAELAERTCRRLRLSNAQSAAVVHLVREHMRLPDLHVTNPRAVDRAVRKLDLWSGPGPSARRIVSAEDALALTIADLAATAHRDESEPERRRLASAIARSREAGTARRALSPLNGDEICAELGILEGELVGAAKRAIESAILAGELDASDREGAVAIARSAVMTQQEGR